MFITQIQWFLSFSFVLWFIVPVDPQQPKNNNAVFKGMENLTKRLGQSFFEFSNAVTKFNELRDSFSRSADSIEDVNIKKLFTNVMTKVNRSLQAKVDAIQKLAAFAEPRAYDYYSTLPPEDPDPNPNIPDPNPTNPPLPPIPSSYFNAKNLNKPPPEKDNVKGNDDDDEDDVDETKYNCTFPTDLSMEHNDHFKAAVNMSVTSVHVPTSIYSCDPSLLRALFWSSDLEETFKNNHQQNPTLSWQYFGSSTGFLRIFPAIQWPNDNNSDKEDKSPDLYDCRFRPWYTAVTSSPKNLLILLDASGSMTGLKRRIAKAVVNSILDTLTENDYVNVFNVSDFTNTVLECTNNTGTPVMLQATLENLRDLRVGLEQRQTEKVTNWTRALIEAFETLQASQGGVESESANCNQAIMIVTDGAPELFKDIFDEMNKGKQVRIFTYLVGRDDTEKDYVQRMACYNQGYFVHVSTIGEVQEQVVKYLQVMSRPMVMSQRREINWTPVYANQAELVESEWQWQEQLRERQKLRAERYKWFYHNVHQSNKNKSPSANKSAIFAFSNDEMKDGFIPYALNKLKSYLEYGTTNISNRNIRRMDADNERVTRIYQDSREGSLRSFRRAFIAKFRANFQNQLLVERNRQLFKDFEFRKFNFFVTASFPVFDLRKFTNTTKGTTVRLANFLGVVGTDISIDDLKNLASPFQLGVNAYAFAITNNGHIVFHPDFRPLYENILKPTYNSVDFKDVELVDKDGLSRNNDPELLQIRKDIIDKDGPEPSDPMKLRMRLHFDSFKRVSIRNHVYVFGKVPKTLYTFGIQVPQNATTYIGEIEVSLHWKDKGINIVRDYFDINVSYTDKDGEVKLLDRNWRVHPDWTYCHYVTPVKLNFPSTKEDILVHFIKRIQQASSSAVNSTWSWGSETLGWGGKEGDHYVCDKRLVQSIVFDAKITKPFSDTTEILQDARMRSLVASFGAELLSDGTLTTIVATRSGLTRWVNHPKNREKPTDLPFTEYHPRATEESWYQRSVDRAKIEEDSYIVSVPFDAGTRNYSRVTVTRAILATKDGKKAPVAVVGVQYDQDKFLSFFGLGPELRRNDQNICQNDDFQCFILDENAFVIGSSEIRDAAGQFFGEVDRQAMDVLINMSIYKEVRIVDFQGICFQPIFKVNMASALLTPVRQLMLVINWAVAYFTAVLIRFNVFLNFPFVLPDSSEYEYEEDISGDRNMPYVGLASVNKTKLRPCDVEYKLFTYGSAYNIGAITLLHKKNHVVCDETCEDYLNVQRIPQTNLILLIVEAKCRCGQYTSRRWLHGQEIVYPIFQGFENKSHDDPILEVCRIPKAPLYRKRILHCHSYEEEEYTSKEDCGKGISLQASIFLILFPVIRLQVLFTFEL